VSVYILILNYRYAQDQGREDELALDSSS
jgi:hypothetical protein